MASSKKPQTVEGIKQYLTQVSSLFPKGQPCIPRFVLERGKAFKAAKLPAKYRQGPQKMCYMNASHLVAEDHSLTYAEGYVSVHGLEFIPLEHAWAVDAKGRVIDNTLKGDTSKNAYFGVEFSADDLMPWLVDTGIYGVFSNSPQNVYRVITTGRLEMSKA